MAPLWPTTQLNVTQYWYWKLSLETRDSQLGLSLPHYLKTSLGLPSYILGSFHFTRFPYQPSNSPQFCLSLRSLLLFTGSSHFSSFPYPIHPETLLPLPREISNLCSPVPSSVSNLPGSTGYSLVIICLMSNIHIQVSIYRISGCGLLHSEFFSSSTYLPTNFMMPFFCGN